MRILGLDLGAKRIGLALSDADASFAFPSGVLESRGRKADLKALGELITERDVRRVVVGLPVHMDGQIGPEARAAEDFARALSEATGLPVDTIDERWTTLEAERSLRELGHSNAKRRREVDAVAAALILRTYLEREHESLRPHRDGAEDTDGGRDTRGARDIGGAGEPE